MKITWASNAPWAPTGYGTQTAEMVKRLVVEHDVVVASNYGLQAAPMPWRSGDTNVLIFPAGVDAYGNDVLPTIARLHETDWIITLYDVWVYKNPDFDSMRIASWAPVDHSPVPPEVEGWARKHPVIAMSRFGQQAFAERGIVAPYAPHALDLNVWRPTPALGDGRTVREALGIPTDAFVVMINAANKGNVPPRKAWGEMLTALGRFMRDHADVFAYIHTDIAGHYGGISIPVALQAADIPPERVRFPDQFFNLMGMIPQSVMAAHYSDADVLLASSMGEGFGIPVIEAQACGTPVIINDFSAQPELLGAGWKTANQPYWDFTQGSYFAVPFIDSIRDALEQAYTARGDATLAEQAIAKAAEYEADVVFERYWKPILADLADQLTPPKVTRRQRRAKRRKAA